MIGAFLGPVPSLWSVLLLGSVLGALLGAALALGPLVRGASV